MVDQVVIFANDVLKVAPRREIRDLLDWLSVIYAVFGYGAALYRTIASKQTVPKTLKDTPCSSVSEAMRCEMMRRAPPLSEQIKQLESEVGVLQARLAELQQHHRLYLVRYTCMRCLAEGLQAFQVLHAGQCISTVETNGRSDPADVQEVLDAEQLQSLVSEEIMLLQQLAEADSTGCCSTSSDDGVLDTGIDTICPHSDPMALFRVLLQQAPMFCAAGKADMTAAQLAEHLRQSNSQLSFQLNKLQASMTAEAAAATIKDTLEKYLQLNVALVAAGRQEVIAQLQTFSLDTLQSEPSFLEAATQSTMRVAPHLGLTEQQACVIATGMNLYQKLMEGIQTEQVCLKFALTGIEPSACSPALSCSSSLVGAHVQQLEEQQQLYQRLQSLLQKEYYMQLAMIGWMVGSLSYEQLAKAHVLCWPYVMRLAHLGIGIQKWYEQNQQVGQPVCSKRSSA